MGTCGQFRTLCGDWLMFFSQLETVCTLPKKFPLFRLQKTFWQFKFGTFKLISLGCNSSPLLSKCTWIICYNSPPNYLSFWLSNIWHFLVWVIFCWMQYSKLGPPLPVFFFSHKFCCSFQKQVGKILENYFFSSVNLTNSEISLGKIHKNFNITELTKKHPALCPPESICMLD